jgi:hypothetical protein
MHIPSSPAWRTIGLMMAIALTNAQAQLFEADSKRLAGSGKMDIVVREIERRPRVSVLAIEIQAVGSSVGSSFFLLCSVRELARQRGSSPYIAKVEQDGRPARMIVGFLASREEDPGKLGPEFAALRAPQDVIDLEQFAPICDGMKRDAPKEPAR